MPIWVNGILLVCDKFHWGINTDTGNCKISYERFRYRYFSDFSSESSSEWILIIFSDVRVQYRCRYWLKVSYWVFAKSTGESILIPAIRKLVMDGSEKAWFVPARVDGALAKWRRHYGEPKVLSGKSSFVMHEGAKRSRVLHERAIIIPILWFQIFELNLFTFALT